MFQINISQTFKFLQIHFKLVHKEKFKALISVEILLKKNRIELKMDGLNKYK